MSNDWDWRMADNILKWATTAGHLTVEEIVGPRRFERLPHWRHAAMYVCRRRTFLTLTEIGFLFGNRHRNTVLYAVQRMDRYNGPYLLNRFDCWHNERKSRQ